MRIILFHPRGYALEKGRRPINALACVMPPLGLASIGAVLRTHRHEVTILDAALEDRVPNDRWARLITDSRPDIVGFSATTPAFNDALDVCRRVKDLNSGIITVFGGAHVSWGKESILREFPEIDYVIAGEGEVSFAKFAGVDAHSSIDGLYYRRGTEIFRGASADTAKLELDSLPFPAYDLLPGFPRRYLMPLFGYSRHPGANIISSRGCVYQCSYCDRSVFGKGFRWNSPEYTFEQIVWLRRTFGVRHINFYDDLFTLNRERVSSLCSRLARARLGVGFNCIVRIGHIDRELLGLLRKAGCWMVSVGIESGDQSILDAHKEGLTLEAVARDVKMIHESGLWVKGLFMIGFPGETEESIVKTREFALSLPLKDANLTAFTPFPGAPISARIEEFGSFENDWSKMNCVNFVFVPREIKSRAVLEHHYGLFFKEFYNRPFMRWKVYPKMLFQSPHSLGRLAGHARSFLRYTREIDK